MDGLLEVTHYQVLGVSKQLLDDAKDAQSLVRRAYRRALLRHHPDKAAASSPPTRGSDPGGAPHPTTTFTVDQIAVASAVLADARRRSEYDAALSLARAGHHHHHHHQRPRPDDFQTGIETVDLDDLVEFDDDDAGEGRGAGGGVVWFRGCRCGNERGFEFGEDDLEPVADLGELIVGCRDCSLWLKVHFAVMPQDGGGEDQHPAADAPS